MDWEQVANLMLNDGIAIAVVGYFMFRDYKFMQQLQVILTTLVDTVGALKEAVKEFSGNEISDKNAE